MLWPVYHIPKNEVFLLVPVLSFVVITILLLLEILAKSNKSLFTFL